MELLDAGLDSVVSEMGGLGGSISGAIGSGFNSMATSLEKPTTFNT